LEYDCIFCIFCILPGNYLACLNAIEKKYAVDTADIFCVGLIFMNWQNLYL